MASGLELTVSLPGLKPLSVALSRVREDIADWTSFWIERFVPGFYRQNLENFVSEGGSSGESWMALSPRYAAWKAAHYPGRGILVRSGALKASLLSPSADGAVFEPGPTSLTVGTNVPYGIYHQKGTWKMPQRPPLRLTPAFMAVVGQSLQKHIEAAWQQRRAEAGAA